MTLDKEKVTELAKVLAALDILTRNVKPGVMTPPTRDNGLRTAPMPRLTITPPVQVTDGSKLNLLEELQKRVVGQDHVLENITSVFYRWEVGMSPPTTPAGIFLLLGPTGVGKTMTCEALADILFGKPNAFIKIDCAEYAHSHEIAKLLGSPPGYLGHRETQPALTQENLSRYHNEKYKCNIVLFDEIEKASDALWNLLLGVLDKATLSLGDNRKVDFSNTFIFMTSNLGAREISKALSNPFGLGSRETAPALDDKKLEDIALQAAKKQFRPEFLNRIDAKLVYRSLSKDHLSKILDQILQGLQSRLNNAKGPSTFMLEIAPDVKKFLLDRGVSKAYGARELKRVVELELSTKLVHLMREDAFNKKSIVKVTLKDGKCNFTSR